MVQQHYVNEIGVNVKSIMKIIFLNAVILID